MAIYPLIALVGVVVIVFALRAVFGGRGSTGATLLCLFVTVLVGGVLLCGTWLTRRAPANFTVVAPSVSVAESGDARAQIRGPREPRPPRITVNFGDLAEPNLTALADIESLVPAQVDEPGWGEPEFWGRWAGSILFNWMRASVERNWTKSPPTVLSFPEQFVVIGRAQLDTKGRRDQRQMEQLWRQVEKKARGSAMLELAGMVRSLHEKSIPALERVERKLERIDARKAERIASRILSKYALDQTGPQQYEQQGRERTLRQSVRYDITRDEFFTGLLEELGESRPQSGFGIARIADHRRSRSAWKMLASFGVVWLLVIGASSVLKAAAARRRA